MTGTDLGALIRDCHALVRRGEAGPALERLEAGRGEHGGSVDFHMNVAIVQRALGEPRAAIRALDAALAIEPYTFMAHLSKGHLLEQIGEPRSAAEVYRDALRIAPDERGLPDALRAQLQQARDLVAAQAQELSAYFRSEMAALLERHGGEDLRRMEECMDVLAGTRRIYHSEPVQVPFPRLPAIPFFDREHFPWLETLEAATDTVRQELQALLDEGLPGFKPYVQYAPGTPENQFKPLNHNQDWSSLWLWKDGVEQTEAQARCPATTALLRELPLADQPGFAPTALFSALAPRTHIPPHTGSTNARLLVHLPLVLPGPAAFRVGNETREWKLGEAWVFDDTIEHEAWNNADETRVIMIFDIWNPLLSPAERELFATLLVKHRDWLVG